MKHEHPVCGRCGTYRHLHPTQWCMTSRRSFWIDEHLVLLHLRGWAWSKVPERTRWRVVNAMHRLAPNRWHWCDLVDAAIKAGPDWIDDYREDWCDLPTPFGVGKPPTEPCYCNNVPFPTSTERHTA